MADIFTEVDDALRQEKMEKFWSDWGKTIIATLVAIVLVTGVSAGWSSWKDKQNIVRTDALFMALEAEDPASEMAKLAEESKGDHRALALLNSAAMLAGKGDMKAAREKWTALSDDPSADPWFRDFGRLSLIMHAPEEKTAEILLKDIAPLLKPDNPWNGQARLYAGVLHAKQGDFDAAINALQPVVGGRSTPQTLRQRAQDLTALYTIQGNQVAAEKDTKE